LLESSNVLSRIRKEAASKLKEVIREGLLDLNFLDVKFEICFQDLDNYSALGLDEVEFMISMNPGEPVRPLGEVASGGELSRIMLAIKTVMAEKDQIETLIFDEIDVGISGRTAQKVSEKMALIGKNHQVICITHLAQIAAMADAHFLIEKGVVNGKTQTSIGILNREEEVKEPARILGGAEITDTVLQSASEMKELAMRTK
ncbi:MAG: DNA repair protein RecN, partial [Lachnospiraceae bacterium]|nr:DNA repair protein RecN [Lachnospiraceae bacterium]